MCRNIRVLLNFEPPTTDDEVQAAAIQYVRKVSGTRKPSKANEARFEQAIEQIAKTTRMLVDAMEEVKFYARMGYNPAQLLEPELKSLADVARPESRTARRFAARIDALLADTARRGEVPEIRAQLEAWRDNDARLAPIIGSAKQAQDIRTLSQRLSAASTIGLAALDAITTQIVSCRVTTNVNLGDVNTIAVTVGSQTVVRDVARLNGWDIVNPNTIELFGAACNVAAGSADPITVETCVSP
jgi:hypothetical protein